MLIPFAAVAQEAYAVYTTDGTLTFYYDKQKSSRSGTKYALNTGYNEPGWYTDHRKDIKKAVFTSSFSGARPTSTWKWFSVKAAEKSESVFSNIVGIQYLNTSEVTNMGWMFAYCINLKELDVSHFNTSKATDMGGMFCDCSSLTTLDVSNFNTSKVTDMAAMFSGCTSLVSLNVSNFNTSNVTNFWYMFKDCSSLNSINVSNFNTSKVTDFCAMFDGCSSLTTIDVSHFNTSNATRLNSMFDNCSSLTSLDLSSFNTSKVTGMAFVFSGCKSLKTLDISHLNSANVTTITGMFYGCSGLTSLDLSHLDTRNVTEMGWMFKGCTKLASLDLSTFNTGKVTEMKYMFDGCTSLITIYAGEDWKTDKVTSSSYMFRNCTKIVGGLGTKYNASHVDVAYAHVDGGTSNPGYLNDKNATASTDEAYAVYTDDGTLTFYYDKQKSSRSGTKYALNTGTTAPGWYTDHANEIKKVVFNSSFANARPTSTYRWFSAGGNRSILTEIVGMQYLNTSKVTDMSVMFYCCSSLTSLDVSHFDTSNVTDMDYMFWNCSGLTSLDVSHFDTNNVTYMVEMFSFCRGLTSLDVSNFDTSSVQYMNAMFRGCSSLTTIDVSHFDTSKVTNMNRMFQSCSSLTSLDVSNFNTSKVTTMYGMFDGCSGLTSLDVSHFDTSNVTDMEGMFYGCSGLTSLDLSSFNTSNVKYMNGISQDDLYDVFGMFENCINLKTIYAGEGWTTDKVTYSKVMFLNCTNLVGGAGTKYDANHVDKAYAHIDGGTSNPGYLTDKNNNELPTTGCDEDWLQQKLDEIAEQKPTEPVELTICEDGITLTKSILVKKECKAILTGGPITAQKEIEFRFGGEGLFMVYGEIGFRNITLNLNNNAKKDGNLGYFWLGDGTLLLHDNAVVNTANGTVVGGWGTFSMDGGTLMPGGSEMIIDNGLQTTISGEVTIRGQQTYCNGSITLDATIDTETGYARFPSFLLNDLYVSTALDLWAPMNRLPKIHIAKDATLNTQEAGFTRMDITGDWSHMSVGRAFVTSSSITQNDYDRMTFYDMPTNRTATFYPNEHAVKLTASSVSSLTNVIEQTKSLGLAQNVTMNLMQGITNTIDRSTNTQGMQEITMDGMDEGSTTRGRMHFAEDMTLTVSPGTTMTLKNLDIDGEEGSEGFIVGGTLIIGDNTHITGFTNFAHVESGGRILISAPLTNAISLTFGYSIGAGQVVAEGCDGYQLTEQDLALIQVEGCELQLDTEKNQIVVVSGTGIETISAASHGTASDGIYTLHGTRTRTARQGVYIIKSGTSTRKVYVK